jgi:uncharacterized protein YbdZ (MbtH family)
VQDQTPPRLLSPWISNRCRLRATAIATECVGPDRQPARTTARTTQRCSLQRSLNDVPYGWNLAHSLGLDDDCVSSDLAKAYEKLDPIAVVPVHTRLVERKLADSVEEFADAIWRAETQIVNGHGVAKYLFSRAVRAAGINCEEPGRRP